MKRFYGSGAAVMLAAGVFAAGVSTADGLSLHQQYASDALAAMLPDFGQWRPFPPCGDRAAWGAVRPAVREHCLAAGERALEAPIPQLPATLYLEYKRIGNRSNYQDLWFQRRELLHALVIAECLENQGRFLDKIADVVWAICEESSWTFPAHVGRQKAGVDLPDVDDPVVALFSAETGASLAWTWYLLGPQLDTVSPMIARRIEREIRGRILTPYLDKQFGWMGFHGGRPNNWNPWINSNVLAAALLIERDADRRLALVDKILRSVDRFLSPYPSDGSCDEGPSYWGHAGASLFDCLEILYSATDGKFDVWDQPIIGEIGRFIYRTHIWDDWFVNVGDCDPHVHIYRDVVWRYGRRIGDRNMQALAAHGATVDDLLSVRYMTRLLYAVFNAPNVLADSPSARPPLLADVWLSHPDMQLMAARDRAGVNTGWFVASWGGHNGQSHNHNDVGNVVVFRDGRPVLVDVGRPTYTRQTFSSRRYEIWAMQSEYHNCPTINGRQQRPGRRYEARDVAYRREDGFAQLQMDIGSAYPQEAGVRTWRRTVRLDRGRQVTVTDAFELSEASGETALNFMTPCAVRAVEPGLVVLSAAGDELAALRYDPNSLRLEVENVPIEDGKLRAAWGPALRRMRLKAAPGSTSGRLTVVLAPPDRS